MTTDIHYLTALELREQYLSRELSPVEVTRHLLSRIERLNGHLNAFITVTPEFALEQARIAEAAYAKGETEQPLLGIPMSIKDVALTKGIRTTRGSLLWKDWVPDEDAPLVESLYGAGAVMLGKTNTPEMGWKGDSGNRVLGPTHNPWKLGHTAGGSSGGAAAAVLAGMGPLAHGTDGAGSVRIPAAFCGVFGMKPSFGVIPYYPPSSIDTLAHNGPLTWTVRDGALMMDVMGGLDARDRNTIPPTAPSYLNACDGDVRGLRIAWSTDMGTSRIDPEVADIARRAADVFTDLGCTVEEIDWPLEDPYPLLDMIWMTAQSAAHRSDFENVKDQLDPGRVAIIEAGLKQSGVDVSGAYADRLNYYDRVRKLLSGYDLLLTPTLPVTAFAAGDDHPGTVAGQPVEYLSWTAMTYPFNLTGHPAATVPCGMATNGLPVGLQIVGNWRDDAAVLKAAASFEASKSWHLDRPEWLDES